MTKVTLSAGGKDQTAALQTAVNVAPEGDTLEIICYGTALVDGVITVDKTITITQTIGKIHADDVLFKPTAGNVILINLNLVGASSGFLAETNTGDGFSLTVEDCRSTNHGVHVRGGDDIVIKNNVLGLGGNATISISGQNSLIEYPVISGNRVNRSGNTGNCYQLTNMVDFARIDNNLAFGGHTGFDCDDGYGLNLTNCRAFDFSKNGFVLKPGTRLDGEVLRQAQFSNLYASSEAAGTNGFDFRLSATLRDCIAEDVSTGFTISQGPKHARLDGCQSVNNRIGVYLYNGNVTVEGHYFEDCHLPMRINGGKTHRLIDAYIEDCDDVQMIQTATATNGRLFIEHLRLSSGIDKPLVRVGAGFTVYAQDVDPCVLKHGASSQGPLIIRGYSETIV